MSNINAQLIGRRTPPRPDPLHWDDLSELDADIATAREYEKHLARQQYLVRKLVMSLQVKRDALVELGEVVWRDVA